MLVLVDRVTELVRRPRTCRTVEVEPVDEVTLGVFRNETPWISCAHETTHH